jgi:hypothetical protein
MTRNYTRGLCDVCESELRPTPFNSHQHHPAYIAAALAAIYADSHDPIWHRTPFGEIA